MKDYNNLYIYEYLKKKDIVVIWNEGIKTMSEKVYESKQNHKSYQSYFNCSKFVKMYFNVIYIENLLCIN